MHKIYITCLVVHVIGKYFNLFSLLMADPREKAKMSYFEKVGYLFTHLEMYSADVSHKFPTSIWYTSNDFKKYFDVCSVVLAKCVWDEEVHPMETATTTNLDIYKSPVLSSKESLLLDFHKVKARQNVMKSKEHNKIENAMREQPGFGVSTNRISKSINLLDDKVKVYRANLALHLPNPHRLLLTSVQYFSKLYLRCLQSL